MYLEKIKHTIFRKETLLHIAYWLFHFASVNSYWEVDWTDRSMRSGMVSPLTVILTPIFFYLNAFWLIPFYLKSRRWYLYFLYTAILLIFTELLRATYFIATNGVQGSFFSSFKKELMSGDNLIIGLPSTLFFAFALSFAYRFTRDWIVNQQEINRLKKEKEVIELSLADTQPVSYPTKLNIKKRAGTYLISTYDITYFDARGDFVIAIDKSHKKHILNQSLKSIEALVDPKMFFRINRSQMVNAQMVEKYHKHTKDRLAINLKESSTILYTSNRRSPEFKTWLTSQ